MEGRLDNENINNTKTKKIHTRITQGQEPPCIARWSRPVETRKKLT